MTQNTIFSVVNLYIRSVIKKVNHSDIKDLLSLKYNLLAWSGYPQWVISSGVDLLSFSIDCLAQNIHTSFPLVVFGLHEEQLISVFH